MYDVYVFFFCTLLGSSFSYPTAECHTGHDVTTETGKLAGELSQRQGKKLRITPGHLRLHANGDNGTRAMTLFCRLC